MHVRNIHWKHFCLENDFRLGTWMGYWKQKHVYMKQCIWKPQFISKPKLCFQYANNVSNLIFVFPMSILCYQYKRFLYLTYDLCYQHTFFVSIFKICFQTTMFPVYAPKLGVMKYAALDTPLLSISIYEWWDTRSEVRSEKNLEFQVLYQFYILECKTTSDFPNQVPIRTDKYIKCSATRSDNRYKHRGEGEVDGLSFKDGLKFWYFLSFFQSWGFFSFRGLLVILNFTFSMRGHFFKWKV